MSIILYSLQKIPFDVLDRSVAEHLYCLFSTLLITFEFMSCSKTKQGWKNVVLRLISVTSHILSNDDFDPDLSAHVNKVLRTDLKFAVKEIILFTGCALTENQCSALLESSKFCLECDIETLSESGNFFLEILSWGRASNEVKSLFKECILRKIKPFLLNKDVIVDYSTLFLPIMSGFPGNLLDLLVDDEERQMVTSNFLRVISKHKNGLFFERIDILNKYWLDFKNVSDKETCLKLLRKMANDLITNDGVSETFSGMFMKLDGIDLEKWFMREEKKPLVFKIRLLHLFISVINTKTPSDIVKFSKRHSIDIMAQCTLIEDEETLKAVLEFMSLLLQKANTLGLNYHVLVSDCMSTLAFCDLDQKLEKAVIFDAVHTMLVLILKLFALKIANMVPIFTSIISKMQRVLAKWCDEQPCAGTVFPLHIWVFCLTFRFH